MRFRIQTRPPLPLVKAWFTVGDKVVQSQHHEIRHLKADICERIQELASVRVDAIRLSIDDFDLLDGELVDVIREGDLVCITKIDKSTSAKRRRSDSSSDSSEEDIPLPKRRRKSQLVIQNNEPKTQVQNIRQQRIAKYQALSLSSSDSDSSDSDSDSDSDTDSDLDLDSDSTDDSESDSTSSESSEDSSESSESESSDSEDSDSSSSASEVSTSRLNSGKSNAPAIANGRDKILEAMQFTLNVPPGQGKSTTHSRNARRKRKRQFEKEANTVDKNRLKAVSEASVNNVPLGERRSKDNVPDDANQMDVEIQEEQGTELEGRITNGNVGEKLIPSTSLWNKNKKSGFKRAMSGMVPQRIVFDEDGTEVNGKVSPPVSKPVSPSKARPRLITPSEKQARGELPDNIFVTSVELELDENGNSTWDYNKKKGRYNWGYENGMEVLDYSGNGGADANDVIELDYGEGESEKTPYDLMRIEKGWEGYSEIKDASLLKANDFVVWKSLAWNPATRTPEMMTGIGRVKDINVEETKLSLEILKQAGANDFSFGDSEAAEEVGKDSEIVLVEYSFEEVVGSSWRMVGF